MYRNRDGIVFLHTKDCRAIFTDNSGHYDDGLANIVKYGDSRSTPIRIEEALEILKGVEWRTLKAHWKALIEDLRVIPKERARLKKQLERHQKKQVQKRT